MSRTNSIIISILAMLIILFTALICTYMHPNQQVEAEENVVQNSAAQITILLPGINEDKSIWSNSGNRFEYEENSIIETIARDRNLVKTFAMEVDKNYYSNQTNTHYKLKEFYVNNSNYIFNSNSSISDTTCHYLVLYEDKIKNQTEDIDAETYNRFKKCLNELISNTSPLYGFNPIVNIIGHGRGGLFAAMYANEYPNNVNKIFSIGANYNGSSCYDMLSSINFFKESLKRFEDNYSLNTKNNIVLENDVASKIYAIGTAMDSSYINELKEDLLELAINKNALEKIVSSIDQDWEQEYKNILNSWEQWALLMLGENVDSTVDAISALMEALSNRKSIVGISMYFADLFGLRNYTYYIDSQGKNKGYDDVKMLDDYECDMLNENQRIVIINNKYINKLAEGIAALAYYYIGLDYYSENSIVRDNIRIALKEYILKHYEYAINSFQKFVAYATNNQIDITEYYRASTNDEKAEVMANYYATELFNLHSANCLFEKIDYEFLIKFVGAIKIEGESLNIKITISEESETDINITKAILAIANIVNNKTNNNDVSNGDYEQLTKCIIDILLENFEGREELFNYIYNNRWLLEKLNEFISDADVSIKTFRWKISILSILNPITLLLQVGNITANEIIEGLSDAVPGWIKLVADCKLRSEIREMEDYAWYNSFKVWEEDDFVFINDGVNSLSSQLAEGQEGINRKAFIFSAEDYRLEDIGNKEYPIAIAHNVECQNEKIINYIVSNLDISSDVYKVQNALGGVEIISINNKIISDTYTIPQYIDGKEVKVIGAGLFSDKKFSELKTINLPSSITEIKEEAFFGCKKLTTINLPNSLTKIGAGAFKGCKELANIDFTTAPHLTSIGFESFSKCGLTSVSIPSWINIIEPAAFGNCSKLKSIVVDQSNGNYSSKDGILYSKDGKTLIQYPIGKQLGSFEIEETVENIGKYAFAHSSLSTIEFNKNIKEIKEHAFDGSEELTEIVLWDNLTMIQSYAFNNCKNLNKVVIYDETPNVALCAFEGCSEGIVFYVPKNTIDSYEQEYGLMFEENIESISYDLVLKINNNSSDDICLVGYSYGEDLNDSLNRIGIHGYVEPYINKDSRFTYISNGDLVFEGWRYDCDDNGNGTGLNAFDEHDYNAVGSEVIIYAKWRPKQYYLQFVYENQNVYVTKNGISSTKEILSLDDSIDFSSQYWDWFKDIAQMEGKKLNKFILTTEPLPTQQAQEGEELEDTSVNTPNFGLPSVEDTYVDQFAVWTNDIMLIINNILTSQRDDILFTIEAQVVTKTTTFVFDQNGGDYGYSNETILYGANYNPPTITRSNYTFGGWEVVSIKAEGDETQYAEYSKYLHRVYNYSSVKDFTLGLSKNSTVYLKAIWSTYLLDVDTGTSELVNQHDVIIMDFASIESNTMLNKRYRITSKVKTITIKNMKQLKNTSFIVEGTLTMNIINCSFMASENTTAIYALNQILTINFTGNNRIQGGIKSEDSLTYNCMAIVASTLKINSTDGNENDLLGGNGKDGQGAGANGKNGGYGVCATNLYFNSGFIVIGGGVGGNGARGSDGSLYSNPGGAGGNGGNGGYAIWLIGTTLNIASNASVICSGGRGGNGGAGGTGGAGRPGADATWKSTAKAGEAGGKGGKAGNGGHGACAIMAPLASPTGFYGLYGGQGGSAGSRGSGGAGGKGGKKKVGGNASSGATGGTGDPGSSGRSNYNYGLS